ncbi:MAG: type II secretion system protein [Nitrospinae bacterium]|nr:type II secretion system protein [Nitrospinota bacterium]
MSTRKFESGFTLLELILALGIVGFIVAISLGAVRLGTAAREVGDLKVDTFQRLRLIGNQLGQKIKSSYPVFVFQDQDVFSAGTGGKLERLLAFEGSTDSLRLVTFASPLTSQGNPPWMHEVRFYLGKHPKTDETGIIMAEGTLIGEYQTNPVFNYRDGGKFFLLAENVAYLKFRYYKVEKLNPAEIELQGDESVLYRGKWVETIRQEPFPTNFGELPKEEKNRLAFEKNNKMSLPRAVEISLGLREPAKPGSEEEPKIVFSPPIVVPLYSGMSFALPVKQDENASS